MEYHGHSLAINAALDRAKSLGKAQMWLATGFISLVLVISLLPQMPSGLLGKHLLPLRLGEWLLCHGKCLLATTRRGVTSWQPLLNLLEASI